MTAPVEVERVILCDEEGHAVGTAVKSEVHHAATPLHLAFSCYLFDPDGRFLLTRRAFTKRTWPGAWTNSCCGHPLPGEPLTDAVARRLAAELGLARPARIDLLLGDFRYRAVQADGVVEYELCPVYRAVTAGRPDPDPAEVAAAEWTAWPGFARRVLAGEQEISPWCAEQVARLVALGPDPLAWPAARPDALPAAARV